jgi:hypothetical protein
LGRSLAAAAPACPAVVLRAERRGEWRLFATFSPQKKLIKKKKEKEQEQD